MSAVKYTDAEIAALVSERKVLPRTWERRLFNLRIKASLSQRRSHVAVTTQDGEFRIDVRQSTHNYLDFSVVVGFQRKNESEVFIIRRYNGRHGIHWNKREGRQKEEITGFHIHRATEEQQRLGREEDAYAEPTSSYTDVYSAIHFALEDANFVKPAKATEDRNQRKLFPEDE